MSFNGQEHLCISINWLHDLKALNFDILRYLTKGSQFFTKIQ
jgi:hypothetical protein